MPPKQKVAGSESCQAYHRINDLPRFSVQPIPRVTKWITEFPNGSRSVPVLEAQRAKRHGLHPQNPPSLDSTPPLLPHGRAHRGCACNTEPSCECHGGPGACDAPPPASPAQPGKSTTSAGDTASRNRECPRALRSALEYGAGGPSP